MDIIVVGRNPEKLKSIQQCVGEIGRKCETVQADLSVQKEIQQAADQLEKIGKEKTVGVLVNNAGVSYRKFFRISVNFYLGMLPLFLKFIKSSRLLSFIRCSRFTQYGQR